MDCDDTFVLTDLPSDTGSAETVTPRVRRCRGCAGCISTNMGTCAIDDSFTGMIPDILSHRTLVIECGISDAMYSMPMRKAVERLANVLQAFTDAGGNKPLDKESVSLRKIKVRIRGPKEDGFEEYSDELLLTGPVESVEYIYNQ